MTDATREGKKKRNKSMEKKKFNLVIRKTFIYPLEVEALTKKEAKQIAMDYKPKREKWILEDIEYIHEEKYKTELQGNALHLYCSQVSKALNEEGVTMVEVLDNFKKFDVFPTMESIKELWRNIQFKLFGFRSTTKLKKDGQIDLIYDPMNKVFSENYGIHLPFPERKLLEYEKMSHEQHS